MEKKTKKSLLIGILYTVVGAGLFSLGIIFWQPIIGIMGSFALIRGIIDTCEFLIKGIKESIKFHKKWKKRERNTGKNIVYENYKEQTTTIVFNKISETTTKNYKTITKINDDALTR